MYSSSIIALLLSSVTVKELLHGRNKLVIAAFNDPGTGYEYSGQPVFQPYDEAFPKRGLFHSLKVAGGYLELSLIAPEFEGIGIRVKGYSLPGVNLILPGLQEVEYRFD